MCLLQNSAPPPLGRRRPREHAAAKELLCAIVFARRRYVVARGQQPLLDGPLSRTRRTHRATGQRGTPVVAGPVPGNGCGTMALSAGSLERTVRRWAGGPD